LIEEKERKKRKRKEKENQTEEIQVCVFLVDYFQTLLEDINQLILQLNNQKQDSIH